MEGLGDLTKLNWGRQGIYSWATCNELVKLDMSIEGPQTELNRFVLDA